MGVSDAASEVVAVVPTDQRHKLPAMPRWLGLLNPEAPSTTKCEPQQPFGTNLSEAQKLLDGTLLEGVCG